MTKACRKTCASVTIFISQALPRRSPASAAPGGGRGVVGASTASARVTPSAPATAAAARPATIDGSNWSAVVEAANLLGMVRQFALNCVPASFENGVLRLRFDESAAHRRTPQIEEKLVQALSSHLGMELRVTFEAAEAELVTPARRRVIADQERATRAAAAFEDDPAVKGLCERFGAEVDLGSVKPTN